MSERLCKMQGGPPIPWELAEAIHKHLYVACFGDIQSLEEIHRRGGFGYEEILWMANYLAEQRAKKPAAPSQERPNGEG